MTVSVLRRIAAVCITIALILSLSACFETPDVIISEEPNASDSTDATVTTTPQTKVTFPAKEGQLTLSLLMSVMSSNMKWSELSPFTFSAVDDTHASFTVADNYGKECTLDVVYDAASDTVSEATLSYGDASVNVLTDNTLVIRTIMLAMNEE